jgi:hypothetical protein
MSYCRIKYLCVDVKTSPKNPSAESASKIETVLLNFIKSDVVTIVRYFLLSTLP